MTEFAWDTRQFYVYTQTPKDHFDRMHQKYLDFLACLNEVQTEQVTVFQPLKEKQLQELDLIREISKVLQDKKDEDIRKSQAAAEEAKEEVTETTEGEVKEEEVEETPAETKVEA